MITREILSYLFALLPAAYAAWWGRRLVRHLDDPAFPELHLRKAHRVGVALGLGIFLSLAFSNQHGVFKLLLVIVAVAAADFPSRRQIFQETWSLAAYLVHGTRFWVALLGAWTLLAFLPEIAYDSGAAALPVAVALGAVIVLWNLLNSRIFPLILGAVPLAHEGLEKRFAAVLAKAKCRPPRLLRAGPVNGTFVNAFALPSLRRSAVVFSHGLLEALGPRETTAIFAHEVGHLEHHTRWRILRQQLVLWLLVALVVAAFFYFGRDSTVARTLTWTWPLGCLLLLVRSLARNQAHEHESDLRAVELCGDAQALIDALTKIHFLTRMPRRWAAASERRMSHPSLAQRLRAIREAAGAAVPAGDGPHVAVRAAGDPTRAVVLAPDRLFWLTGVPADAELDPATAWSVAGESRAILYSDLTDLRLEVGGFKGRRLTATDRRGRTMKLALVPEDVAAVKAGVERIDRHVLGTAPGMAPEIAATTGLVWIRLQAVIALVAALTPPFAGPLALAALLVVIRPALATLAAAGTIGVASALLGWWRPSEALLVGGDTATLTVLAIRLFLGLLFLGHAWLRWRRRYPDPPWTRWVTALVLGGFAALAAVGLALRFAQPYPLMQVHLWARGGPGLVLLLLGLAVALWTWRRRRARLPALALAALAALIVAAGTHAFRERYGGDPLRTLEPRLQLESRAFEKVREVPVEKTVTSLELSPSGERLALAGYGGGGDSDDGDEYYGGFGYRGQRFDVEGPHGGFVTLTGATLELLDDHRVALLAFGDEAMELVTVTLAPRTDDDFEIALPYLVSPRLRVDGDRWEVLGRHAERQEVLRLTGRFGAPGFDRRSWSLEAEDVYYSSLYVNAADRVLALGNRYGSDGAWLPYIPFFGAATTELATLEPSGPRRLATTALRLQCADAEPEQRDFYCLATDSEWTQLWSVDPEVGFEALGSLAGEYWELRATGDGRLLLRGDDPLVLVDPAISRAARIGEDLHPGFFELDHEEPGAVEDWLVERMAEGIGAYLGYETFAVRGRHLAVAVMTGESSRIDVYRLPPVSTASPESSD